MSTERLARVVSRKLGKSLGAVEAQLNAWAEQGVDMAEIHRRAMSGLGVRKNHNRGSEDRRHERHFNARFYREER